jgi:hypothetical protein
MIATAGRRFVALRKASSLGSVYHAVTPYCRPALCGNEPGPSSHWAEQPADKVTCPLCVKRLAGMARLATSKARA